MVQKNKSEWMLIGTLAVISVISIALSSNIKSMQMAGELLTAKRYLNLINGFLLVTLAARLFITSSAPGKEAVATASTGNKKVMYIVMAAVLAYAVGISYVGFYVTTFAFLMGLYVLLEGKSKKSIITGAIFGVGVNVIFFVVFNLLSIYLPDGLLF